MLRRTLLPVLTLLSIPMALLATPLSAETNSTDIRVVPVARSPEPNTVRVQILFPEKMEVKQNEPIRMQVKVWGFPFRVNTDLPRIKEIQNSPEGQNIRIVVDDKHFFSIDRANVKSLDSRDNFYTQIAEVTIPFDLAYGEHIVRAFPVRSYGESLKNRGSFAVETFFFRSRSDTIDQNLKGPYLTYNEPAGTFDTGPDLPILLDFLLSNTELSQDGYKVELTIDNHVERILTLWIPYYIYGLTPGTHTIRLRLLDSQNKSVAGAFNDVTETIRIR